MDDLPETCEQISLRFLKHLQRAGPVKSVPKQNPDVGRVGEQLQHIMLDAPNFAEFLKQLKQNPTHAMLLKTVLDAYVPPKK